MPVILHMAGSHIVISIHWSTWVVAYRYTDMFLSIPGSLGDKGADY